MSELWRPNFARDLEFNQKHKVAFNDFIEVSQRFPANLLAQGVGVALNNKKRGAEYTGLKPLLSSEPLVIKIKEIADTMHRDMPGFGEVPIGTVFGIINSVDTVGAATYPVQMPLLEELLANQAFCHPVGNVFAALFWIGEMERVTNLSLLDRLYSLF